MSWVVVHAAGATGASGKMRRATKGTKGTSAKGELAIRSEAMTKRFVKSELGFLRNVWTILSCCIGIPPCGGGKH